MATTTATATRTVWAIDPVHSSIEFAVRHLMIATVKGRFAGVSGTVVTDGFDLSNGEVEVAIDPATIDTREADRDAHLRSADFFDVERFPAATFKSRGVDNRRGDRFELAGDLTLRGVTQPVVLDVTTQGFGKDPWGGERAGFSASTTIKRSAFGLTWNQLLEAGGVAVGDEVRLTIDAELVKQAA